MQGYSINSPQAGINNLIVDLRYNGGGYVDLQADLANYIINNSANGNVMMNQIYNNTHSNRELNNIFSKGRRFEYQQGLFYRKQQYGIGKRAAY